jgi:hypothetical protein
MPEEAWSLPPMRADTVVVDSRGHGWTMHRVSSGTEQAIVSSRRAEMDGADGNSGFGWALVIGGLVMAGIGLIWVLAPHLPRLGRLPGDIVIERENSRFYFPLVTCIVVSIVLSLVMWLVRAVRR